MLDKLTKEMFAQYMGEAFHVQLESSDSVTLELIEVTPLPERSSAAGWGYASNQQIRREPFSVVFRGPRDLPLSQRMYTLEHDKMGTLDGPFLVPIGEDDQWRYYESIFN